MPLDGLQLGHYRLLRLIGSGGMGEVYLAEDPRINQQVAIKVLHTGPKAYADERRAQEAIRFFLREARAVAALDHPHIVPLFAFDEVALNETVLTYLVMPFFAEGSLAHWIRRSSGPSLLAPRRVVQIILQAAGALQHAHDHHIIHQDVKPPNFLARSNTKHPAYPEVFLADFGVAKFSSATSSTSLSIRGTPTYMAPEQWKGQPVAASDQYALAIMAYELLAGRPPFHGPPMQVMYLHAHAQPPPASAVNPRLSPAHDYVLQVALAKGPQERFPSITAFADALHLAVQGNDSATLLRNSDWDSASFVKEPLANLPASVKTPQVPISSGDGVVEQNVSPSAPDTGSTGVPASSTFGPDESTRITADSNATLHKPPVSTPDTPVISYQHAAPPTPVLHPTAAPITGSRPHGATRVRGFSTAKQLLLILVIVLSLLGSAGILYAAAFASLGSTWAPAPPVKVTGVTPQSGPEAGGTTATITGTGFKGAAAVSFGSVRASSWRIESDTQITATSPAGSGTVDVTVTIPAATSATSSADRFTYNTPSAPPPTPTPVPPTPTPEPPTPTPVPPTPTPVPPTPTPV